MVSMMTGEAHTSYRVKFKEVVGLLHIIMKFLYFYK
jgi:hypothetical protein